MLLLTACSGAKETLRQENKERVGTAISEEITEVSDAEEAPKIKMAVENNEMLPDPTDTEKVAEKEAGDADVENVAERIAEEATEDVMPEPETLGNPRSSYGLGSAPFLEGDNILVSMFVTTPESSWSEEEKSEMLSKVGVAADYIEAQAKGYGAEVELYYDYTLYPSLYTEAVTDFCINEETDFLDRLDEEIALWFEEKIDYEMLLDEFDALGIATMVFVNNPGISYAIVYDGTDNVKESLVMFSGDYYNGGKSEKPVTYAHEILHLFGAHDLYEEAEFTAEVTTYIEEVYPKEIMLTVTGGRNTQTAISAELSPITAYHLGWIDEIEEVHKFPQLERE